MMMSGEVGENFTDSDEDKMSDEYGSFSDEEELSYLDSNVLRTQDLVPKMNMGPAAHNGSSGSKKAAGPASGQILATAGPVLRNGTVHFDPSVSSISGDASMIRNSNGLVKH